MVEYLAVNEAVLGSNPSLGALGTMAERSKAEIY